MTKILYNRAAKTFMDAISAGFDEDGAYAKVEKKHGKVLADAVWTEAQAEMKAMKKNPRAVKSWKELIRFLKIQESLAEKGMQTKDLKKKQYAVGFADAMKTVREYINE